MENLVKATLNYLAYCASKEPRIGQHYPVVESANFRKQLLEPRPLPIVEEILGRIDFDSLQDTPENRLLKELSRHSTRLHWRNISPDYAGHAFAQNYTACIFAAPDFEFWEGAHYHLDN